jgi:hypothetical protein
MPMPSLTEGHKKLELFVGNWAGEEKISPSPFDSEGGVAIGRAQNRLALHGFAVIQDYEQERSGEVNMRGHGVIVWNDAEKNYEFHWYDSSGMPPGVFRGQCENNVFTMTNNSSMGFSRCVFNFSDLDTYVFQLDVSQDGESWMTFMRGKYKKQGA